VKSLVKKDLRIKKREIALRKNLNKRKKFKNKNNREKL
tara:strand:- start:29 stop:142 length:114 start_codon:yes stop_codon:yes gene_type:complete